MTAQEVWDAIVKYPDPSLRQRTEKITHEAALDETISRIMQMSEWGTGRIIGLSSVQIACPGRVITYQRQRDSRWCPLVNPVVLERSDEYVLRAEGCGSLPVGEWYMVPRPLELRLQHEEGILEARGGDARIILHELDHIDGILIKDYLGGRA